MSTPTTRGATVPPTTNDDLCAYSDLSPEHCAHCTGDRLGAGPTGQPEAATPPPPRAATAAPQPPSTAGLTVIRTPTPDAPLDLHELIDELIRRHAHREPTTVRTGTTTWTSAHITPVPSLIDQLRSVTASSTGEAGAGGYASRPAAHLESLDTLAYIDLEAARGVRDLGEDDHHTDTAATIRQLHGLSASASPETRRAIEHDVRRWWTQARIVTGWDSAAWRPDNTCPACEKRGTLRVRLATHAGLCIDCRQTWDASTIGLLADHIRGENAEDGAA
jgi:hypothetical protein